MKRFEKWKLTVYYEHLIMLLNYSTCMNTHLLSIIYKWLKKTTNGNQFLIIIGVSVYVFFEIFGYRI